MAPLALSLTPQRMNGQLLLSGLGIAGGAAF